MLYFLRALFMFRLPLALVLNKDRIKTRCASMQFETQHVVLIQFKLPGQTTYLSR